MALSLLHHPQTNGQTEILNAALEQMLQAYVGQDHLDWLGWLSCLAFTYNSSVHSSTGYRPDFLLMGFHLSLSSTFITNEEDPSLCPFLPSQEDVEFIQNLDLH